MVKKSIVQKETEKAVIALAGIGRVFEQAGQPLSVLQDVTFSAQSGEIIALVGPSGSGKSTLLQVIGLLEPATSGVVSLLGHDCSTLNDRARTQLRRESIGFIYQAHRLLPDFSALENVMLPMLIAGVPKSQARTRANDLLESVRLAGRLSHRPAQLSGGEQQRVALARAMANRPKLILADEPTGNLDSHTAEIVFQMFLSLVQDHGVTALIATHNPAMATRMDRTLYLHDGRLQTS